MSEATLKAATLARLGASGATWIKGANARTAAGKPCPALSPLATKWDVMGAMLKAQETTAEPDWKSFHALYKTLRNKIPLSYVNQDLESYNDDVAWAAIAALFA